VVSNIQLVGAVFHNRPRVCLECMSRTCEHIVPVVKRIRPLTSREIDLLRLLYHGLSNKEIASSLRISAETVKVYLTRLYDKVGVPSRWAASLWARDHARLLGIRVPRVRFRFRTDLLGRSA
jgi:DNA-binding NarL/FixJ family response regulator